MVHFHTAEVVKVLATLAENVTVAAVVLLTVIAVFPETYCHKNVGDPELAAAVTDSVVMLETKGHTSVSPSQTNVPVTADLFSVKSMVVPTGHT
jgi:hypothetical protein